jgi:hypothetical protein
VTANQSVARLLAAVEALGGSEWSEADQVRYVRTFLEEGIDALARAEEARFDFLADCAMLASHNMQDARLHVTDERRAELENPDGDATAGACTSTCTFDQVAGRAHSGLPVSRGADRCTPFRHAGSNVQADAGFSALGAASARTRRRA